MNKDSFQSRIEDTREYLINNRLPLPHFLVGSATISNDNDEYQIVANALFNKEQLGRREHINAVHYGSSRNNLFRILINTQFPNYQPLIRDFNCKAHQLQRANSELLLEGRLKDIKERQKLFFANYDFIVSSSSTGKIIFEETGSGILLPYKLFLEKLGDQ